MHSFKTKYGEKYVQARLESSFAFALLFIRHGGSFPLLDECLRYKNKTGWTAVEFIPIYFHCLSKNLRDDEGIFRLSTKSNENINGYASEKLRNTFLSNQKI